MKATHRMKRGLAAIASMLAIVLLEAPAARAHDDDSYDYDEYDHDAYGYDDHARWSGDSCDQACVHGVAIPHYDGFRGYGAWRWVPAFGAHLWFPYVDISWRPYYYGHWIRTSFGMTWVSHEPWGYVPHHYGHWVFVEPFGWGWVPGWEYAPAWVTWGVVDGYIGWAPCPPPGYRYPHYHRYRTSIHISTYGYGGAFGYHDSGLDFGFWIFVGNGDFYGRPVYRCALPPQRSLSFFKTKRVLPVGPRLDVGYVQKVTPEKIRTIRVDRTTKRVGDRSISLYEPRGQKELIRSGQDVVKRTYVKPAKVEHESRDPGRSKVRIEKPQPGKGPQPAAPPARVKAERPAGNEAPKAESPRKVEESRKVEKRQEVRESRSAQEPPKSTGKEKGDARRADSGKVPDKSEGKSKERSKSGGSSERPSKRAGK